MPPRTVKRGGSAGTRKTPRSTRGTPKAQAQNLNQAPPEANEDVKVEEVSAAVGESKEEPKVEDRPVLEEKPAVAKETPVVSVHENDISINSNRLALDINVEAIPEPNGLRSK